MSHLAYLLPGVIHSLHCHLFLTCCNTMFTIRCKCCGSIISLYSCRKQPGLDPQGVQSYRCPPLFLDCAIEAAAGTFSKSTITGTNPISSPPILALSTCSLPLSPQQHPHSPLHWPLPPPAAATIPSWWEVGSRAAPARLQPGAVAPAGGFFLSTPSLLFPWQSRSKCGARERFLLLPLLLTPANPGSSSGDLPPVKWIGRVGAGRGSSRISVDGLSRGQQWQQASSSQAGMELPGRKKQEESPAASIVPRCESGAALDPPPSHQPGTVAMEGANGSGEGCTTEYTGERRQGGWASYPIAALAVQSACLGGRGEATSATQSVFPYSLKQNPGSTHLGSWDVLGPWESKG